MDFNETSGKDVQLIGINSRDPLWLVTDRRWLGYKKLWKSTDLALFLCLSGIMEKGQGFVDYVGFPHSAAFAWKGSSCWTYFR